jgi:hypothetical protein
MNGFRQLNHWSRAALVLVAVGLHTIWFSADAQELPASPIRVFVPTAPATSPNVISRVIATELPSAEHWKVSVPVTKTKGFATFGRSYDPTAVNSVPDSFTVRSQSGPFR